MTENNVIFQQKLDRIDELVASLNRHRDLYYVHSAPEITDAEYDLMFDELNRLEEETGYIKFDSPTQNVGVVNLPSKLEKVKHDHPMLSLDKVHTVDEVYDFVQKHGLCMMSLKLDGLTMSLHYDENGDLVSAETRGDGEIGEQVLANAKLVKNIPTHISNNGIPFTIDGEMISYIDEFEDYNNTLPKEERFAHVRNFASGSIRLLNSKESGKRPLSFVAWRVIEGAGVNNMNLGLSYACGLGFDVVPRMMFDKLSSKEEIEEVITAMREMAEDNYYPIDGMVIAVNDIEYGESLGLTGHHPRHSIAWKPAVEKQETTIRDITWKVGKTGMIAPKAIFDTVILDGTEVSAATLHNLSYIIDMQIGIGSRVEVIKANLIIPKVIGRVSEPISYDPPKTCPCCGSPVEIRETKKKEPDGTERTIRVLYCPSDTCPEKSLGKFAQFVSKHGMNIDGLSEKRLEDLIDNHFLTTFESIYKLEEHPEIADLEGWGQKSFDKVCEAIRKSKDCKLENVIVALSIPNIGKSAAKVISKHFKGSFKEFVLALSDGFDFTTLEDFGPTMAQSLYDWWNNYKNNDNSLEGKNLFNQLNIIPMEENKVLSVDTDNFCNGKTFVVTGKFEKYKRSELEQVITDRGGKLSGSVSKKTDYLLTNEQSGSSKYKKAMELGIPTMTEEEFCTKVGL